MASGPNQPDAGSAEPFQLAIVVVNYGSHHMLRDYLAWTVRDQASERQPPLVVVVDNFRSTADSANMAQLAEESGWHLVVAENLGFGVGVNLGAEAAWRAGADAILVANPDLRLGAADFDAIAEAVVADPTALFVPLLVDLAGRPWSRPGRVDIRRARLTVTDDGPGWRWVTGACFALQKAAWLTIGGMDPDYFMYWEDVDLCVRHCAAGGSIRVLSDVVLVHDVGGTQGGSEALSDTYFYYNCRNRLIFAEKHLRNRDVLRWLVLTPRDTRRVLGRGTFPSRTTKVRTALPPAFRGCVAGGWWILSGVMRKPRERKGRSPHACADSLG